MENRIEFAKVFQIKATVKIFLSFLQSKHQHPISAYSFWEYYLKNGLTEGAHEWVECEDVDWARGLVPQSEEELSKWKSTSWEKTLHKIKLTKPAIFLSYLYPQQIDEQAISEIKKLGVYCVNFFCDHVREFSAVPAIFGIFDLNWVPEHAAIAMYKKAGFDYIYLPMPMWVAPSHRNITTTETGQLSFIGSYDVQRLLLLEELTQTNFPFEVYGSGWLPNEEKPVNQPLHYPVAQKLLFQYSFLTRYGLKAYIRKLQQRNFKPSSSNNLKSHLNGKINFENYVRITQDSMITLGINRYPSFNFPLRHPNTYSRLRDIEAPMLGACYLTEFTAGLEELYDVGKDILVYKNTSELIEKANWLKEDVNMRFQLRKNAQQVALNEHSIPNAIAKIIQRQRKTIIP